MRGAYERARGHGQANLSRWCPGTAKAKTMKRQRAPMLALGSALLTSGLVLSAVPNLAAAEDKPTYTAGDCPAPAVAPTFEQDYIDTARAGGEPIIETHPDGTLLWGSHAGTTHVYVNPTFIAQPNSQNFIQNYEGQTYYYFSADNGQTWNYVPRTPIRDQAGNGQSGVPVSGFSDPEFAIDLAGNVYISEINLANIAVSKSTDSGRSYVLQSLAEITASDRQWMEADEEDVLYFVANTFGGGSASSGNPVTGSLNNSFYKSVDGGVTFSEPQEFVPGQASSDIKVDRADGTVYQLNTGGSTLSLFRLPNARNEMPPNMTVEEFPIAEGYSRNSTIDPTIELDAEGNLYVTWAGTFEGEQGVWYTYSTDRGETWLDFPVKVSDGDETKIWSWIKIGDTGGVTITWLQADEELPGNDQEASTGPWHVWAAVSQNGLGCATSPNAGFVVTQASTEPPHTGQICATGTTCEAFAVDRRLGDYFSHTVDEAGNMVIAVSDTRQGGAISLPLVIRQTSGASVRGFSAPAPAPTTAPVAAPAPAVAPVDTSLPATGGGLAFVGLGVVTIGLALRKR